VIRPTPFEIAQTEPLRSINLLLWAIRRLPVAPESVTHWTHREAAMNKDQVKGRIRKAKGKVKETAGKLVGNKRLEQKGKIEQATGAVQTGYGDLRSDVKKSV
jgi:uncharacterized protein YjbJ (UPF0337 family)